MPGSTSPAVLAQRSVARLLGSLPDATKVRLSGRPPVRIDGEELEPGIQLTMRLQALRGNPSFITAGAQEVSPERRRIRSDAEVGQGRRTPVGAVRDLVIDAGDAGDAGGDGDAPRPPLGDGDAPRPPLGDGDAPRPPLGDGDAARPPLRARHYVPPSHAAGAPLLVFLHGGGWVVGDLDTHDEVCRLLCRHAGLHVVSVDYSLAPEHPFPAGVRDARAAVAWALREAAGLGADPDRVAVGGDSAGGNLAAVCCQAFAADPDLRAQADGRQPALQVLIYPGTDLTDREWPSKAMFADGFYLDAPSRRWCQERYLCAGGDPEDPLVSPLYGELAGVAPAIVVTAAFDPLRDEGEAYGAALDAAGVRVVCVRMPGMIHGFISMTGVNRSARDAVMRLCGMVRAELSLPRRVPSHV